MNDKCNLILGIDANTTFDSVVSSSETSEILGMKADRKILFAHTLSVAQRDFSELERLASQRRGWPSLDEGWGAYFRQADDQLGYHYCKAEGDFAVEKSPMK